MTTQNQAEMHTEHRSAESDIESWIDDVYMWTAEHKQALAWLSQMEAAIHEHNVQLQQHRSNIDKLERHIRQHEHEIAMQDQKGESCDGTALADQHAVFMQGHAQAAESHARIGQFHRKHFAELHRLKKQFLDES